MGPDEARVAPIAAGGRERPWSPRELRRIATAVAVTAAVFFPALDNQFVNWDDDAYIVDSRVIEELSAKNVWSYFTDFHHGLYQPLTLLSFAFDHALGGPDPFVYHLVNVLLHLASTALVFALVWLLAGRSSVAFVSALVFGVHTLHVESVAWVTERKDVLYAFFFLASCVAYVRYVQAGERRLHLLALALFLLSLLAKAQAVSLAVTLLVLDFWFGRSLKDRKVWIEKLPFLALALLFGIMALIAQASAGAIDTTEHGPLVERIGFASYALVHYVMRLFAPVRLSAIYPYPQWEGALSPEVWLYPLIVVVGLAGVAYSVKRSRVLAVGVGWFLVNIALMLQVVPAGTAFMADRFTYVASVGFAFLIGMGYRAAVNGTPRLRPPLTAGLAAWILFLGGLTLQRVEVWQDSISLWSDVLDKHPGQPFALNNRGIALAAEGDVEGALRDYDRAIQVDPSYSKPYENRGNVRLSRGHYAEAIEDYSRALERAPSEATAYYNRGLAWDYLGDPRAAIRDYDEAIRLDPDLVDAYYSRGGARGNTGDLAGAADDFDRAAQLDPDDPRPVLNRGVVWLAMGDTTSACRDWMRASRMGSAAASERLNGVCM